MFNDKNSGSTGYEIKESVEHGFIAETEDPKFVEYMQDLGLTKSTAGTSRVIEFLGAYHRECIEYEKENGYQLEGTSEKRKILTEVQAAIRELQEEERFVLGEERVSTNKFRYRDAENFYLKLKEIIRAAENKNDSDPDGRDNKLHARLREAYMFIDKEILGRDLRDSHGKDFFIKNPVSEASQLICHKGDNIVLFADDHLPKGLSAEKARELIEYDQYNYGRKPERSFAYNFAASVPAVAVQAVTGEGLAGAITWSPYYLLKGIVYTGPKFLIEKAIGQRGVVSSEPVKSKKSIRERIFPTYDEQQKSCKEALSLHERAKQKQEAAKVALGEAVKECEINSSPTAIENFNKARMSYAKASKKVKKTQVSDERVIFYGSDEDFKKVKEKIEEKKVDKEKLKESMRMALSNLNNRTASSYSGTAIDKDGYETDNASGRKILNAGAFDARAGKGEIYTGIGELVTDLYSGFANVLSDHGDKDPMAFGVASLVGAFGAASLAAPAAVSAVAAHLGGATATHVVGTGVAASQSFANTIAIGHSSQVMETGLYGMKLSLLALDTLANGPEGLLGELNKMAKGNEENIGAVIAVYAIISVLIQNAVPLHEAKDLVNEELSKSSVILGPAALAKMFFLAGEGLKEGAELGGETLGFLSYLGTAITGRPERVGRAAAWQKMGAELSTGMNRLGRIAIRLYGSTIRIRVVPISILKFGFGIPGRLVEWAGVTLSFIITPLAVGARWLFSENSKWDPNKEWKDTRRAINAYNPLLVLGKLWKVYIVNKPSAFIERVYEQSGLAGRLTRWSNGTNAFFGKHKEKSEEKAEDLIIAKREAKEGSHGIVNKKEAVEKIEMTSLIEKENPGSELKPILRSSSAIRKPIIAEAIVSAEKIPTADPKTAPKAANIIEEKAINTFDFSSLKHKDSVCIQDHQGETALSITRNTDSFSVEGRDSKLLADGVKSIIQNRKDQVCVLKKGSMAQVIEFIKIANDNNIAVKVDESFKNELLNGRDNMRSSDLEKLLLDNKAAVVVDEKVDNSRKKKLE